MEKINTIKRNDSWNYIISENVYKQKVKFRANKIHQWILSRLQITKKNNMVTNDNAY